MEIADKISLSKVRLEYAKECFGASKDLLRLERYKDAASRSYYAIFHAMRAVLALDGIDRKKHSSVMAEFRRLYIKNKIFPEKMSEMITSLFEIRLNSDYMDFYILSKKDVVKQLNNAEYFINRVEKYLKGKYKK